VGAVVISMMLKARWRTGAPVLFLKLAPLMIGVTAFTSSSPSARSPGRAVEP
jgi:hypothetical protein